MAGTNPNGANQYLLDPRQNLCWKYYATPTSETFGNATQSAIKAGYSEVTADQITTHEWFLGRTRRMNLLNKAEKVLEDMLDLPVQRIEIPRFYDEDAKERVEENPESYLVTDSSLVKIKQDTAKFVAERQGKDVGYSTRNELTGKDGDALIPERADEELAKSAIDSLLSKHGTDTEDSTKQGPEED